MKLSLAQPRGPCAGVDRAVAIVERALERFGAPLYVRREIVHNRYTVCRLREAGVIFVEELHEVPDGGRVIFSAHGVSPAVKDEAARRELTAIDATCPLVSKVHGEVLRYAKKGYHLLLVGHDGHDEVLGTRGHAPSSITLVESVEQAEQLALPAAAMSGEQPLFVVTQTTLSVDDTQAIVEVLERRFPQLERPKSDDICYATQNRQDAVKALCEQAGVDLLLVVGSENSSNSQRLVEIARARGVHGELIDGPDDLEPSWLSGKTSIGLSAGASSPEVLVQRVIARLRELGAEAPVAIDTVDENVVFSLPKELRE
jgi:4-hydroxy-3-methylbut-2-enyl diphosphate reductase